MMDPLWPGIAIIIVAMYALYRQCEVRLTLLITALMLGLLAGDGWVIVQKFFETFVNERFVVPICSAMGFAAVVRHTGCDQHLVQLLVQPLKKVRFLLLPGTVVVGFLVNMPLVSQTSTAATIGPVLIPVLLAAGFRPLTIGAALLLGSSIGGELLNPAAPELNTVIEKTAELAPQYGFNKSDFNKDRCIQHILPLNLLGMAVGTAVFWFLARRHEAQESGASPALRLSETTPQEVAEPPFKIHPLKALVPLLPLILLYLNFFSYLDFFRVFEVHHHWLVDTPPDRTPQGRAEVRLIGLAMLIGVAAAALLTPRRAPTVATAFFEGAGYGFTHITSLIVAAICFGKGIELIGLAVVLKDFIQYDATLLFICAAVFSWVFAILCGSGMAATSSLFGFFAKPAFDLGLDPMQVGAVVSIASAAGRTMSPVAAVALLSAALTGTEPLKLVRMVALPLMAALVAVTIAAILTAQGP